MKILIVNKFLYPNGGSETYILELGRQLQAMGHEVQYFGMEHPDMCVGNALGAYTSNMDFHSSNKFKKAVLPFKIIYSFEARRKIRMVLDDFKPDVVHLNNINFQITPSVIYEIRKWDKDRHNKNTHDTEYQHGEVNYGNRCSRTKIIYTAHDYQWICPNHMLYIPVNAEEQSRACPDEMGNTNGKRSVPVCRGEICDRCKGGHFIECTKHNCIHNSKARSLIGSIEGYYYKWRKTYSMVDTIICPSRFLYDKFADNTRLKDKLVVMHNFIERNRDSGAVMPSDVANTSDNKSAEQTYSAGAAHSISCNASGNYVLYFGRFAEEKGVRTLLETTKYLPDIPFVFAGSGPLEDEIRSFADNNDNVSFVGFKTGDELKELISKATFSVYPSEWYENCPFSVMESISLGIPVLGSDIGGIPELIICSHTKKVSTSASECVATIRSEECGLLFKPGDITDMSDKIRTMWSDRDMLSKLIDNCSKSVFYSLEEYTKKFIDLVQ